MARLVFVNRFYAPDHSATSAILSDLCRHLAARGHDVTVVASRLRYDDPAARLPAEETLDGVRVVRVATTRFGRAGIAGRAADYASFYAAATAALSRLVAPGTIVVGKTDPPLIGLATGRVARAHGGIAVNWLQDVYPETAARLGMRLFAGPLGRMLAAARDAGVRRAAANVVLGGGMARFLLERGVAAERIAVIPNWADDLAIRPLPHDANPLRAEWGLEGRFVVAYSGNLGRAHDSATMLAAARLLADDPRIVFLMIGGGHGLAEVRAAAADLPNLRLLPYQPAARLAESLGAADLHWVSLRPVLEGLIVPSKVYGILAAGRPILALGAADGEVATLVREADCGMHVAEGDAEGFATAVRRLADDPAEAARLGANARAAAEARYSRATALATWEALVERLTQT